MPAGVWSVWQQLETTGVNEFTLDSLFRQMGPVNWVVLCAKAFVAPLTR